ncbi:hypothetical protein [Wolbachia endosymbiont (group A) of Tiphia femorata]|uniref:hypothetical protein n=1 Tax=Wolbachia endosymbiont (group A) of Tiphia femorata TaxID=2954063 RepID=UPI0022319517|nr:hypothetical protein [Wolbachia endosymbiont (group A) of Tiphia femorata]
MPLRAMQQTFIFVGNSKVLKSSEEGRPSSLRQQYGDETTDEDLRNIAEKSPIVKLAYDELDKFSWEEEDLAAYEERVLSVQKEAAIWEKRLDDATEKGILIDEEKGEMKAKMAVAKNLLKAGMSVDLIAESTGLPQAEIAQLKKEISQ